MGDNVEVGIYPLQIGLDKAKELELDLVEISPKAAPPVCKIIDYKKIKLELKEVANKIDKKFNLGFPINILNHLPIELNIFQN